jgi:hypothetical protein
MMEAASTSETSVNIYQTTQRNNLEDGHLLANCQSLFFLWHLDLCLKLFPLNAVGQG